MIDSKFLEITNEATTIRRVFRGLEEHVKFRKLASFFRASDPIASLYEMEVILANEDADVDRVRRMDVKLLSLLR